MRSTRSASSTYGCVGSSIKRDRAGVVASSPVSAVYIVVARNGPGRGGVSGLLEEEAEVGGRTGAERGVLRQVPPQRLRTRSGRRCARARARAGTRARATCGRCRGGVADRG